MHELELDHEVAELLPDRETLALVTVQVLNQIEVANAIAVLSPKAIIAITQTQVGILHH